MDIPRLKTCKTCVGCKAYDDKTNPAYRSSPSGGCMLNFPVTTLKGPDTHVGRMSGPDLFTHYCKPAGQCYKPTTLSQYTKCITYLNQSTHGKTVNTD